MNLFQGRAKAAIPVLAICMFVSVSAGQAQDKAKPLSMGTSSMGNRCMFHLWSNFNLSAGSFASPSSLSIPDIFIFNLKSFGLSAFAIALL